MSVSPFSPVAARPAQVQFGRTANAQEVAEIRKMIQENIGQEEADAVNPELCMVHVKNLPSIAGWVQVVASLAMDMPGMLMKVGQQLISGTMQKNEVPLYHLVRTKSEKDAQEAAKRMEDPNSAVRKALQFISLGGSDVKLNMDVSTLLSPTSKEDMLAITKIPAPGLNMLINLLKNKK